MAQLKDMPDGPIPDYPMPRQRSTGMSLRERFEGDGSKKMAKEERDAAIREWTKLPELEKNIQLLKHGGERGREERLSRIPRRLRPKGGRRPCRPFCSGLPAAPAPCHGHG